MNLDTRLNELVENGTISTWVLENVSEDGEVGVESKFRNTKRLTLNFTNGKNLVIDTSCSGSFENTYLV